MKFSNKNRETTSFKKRYNMGYRLPKLTFGNFSLTLCKSYNLEFIYLFNFKKSLKRFCRLRKKTTKKVWLFLHKNYPITKKSKGSRMGKGKGSLSRYCPHILHNHNLFEFSGFNLKDLIRLKKIFCKKVKIPVKINCSFFLNKCCVYGSVNEYLFFNRKYRK